LRLAAGLHAVMRSARTLLTPLLDSKVVRRFTA
jgi:hypothetical protein